MSFTLGIYIDMDSVLDTRYALMSEAGLSSEEILKGFLSEPTTPKDFANIAKIPVKEWQRRWRERDETLLPKSIVTQVMLGLNQLISRSMTATDDFQRLERIDLQVNVWPYKISPLVLGNITTEIGNLLGDMFAVTHINVPIEQQTVEWWKNRKYDQAYMYQFLDWLSIHQDAVLASQGLNITQFLAPMITAGHRKTDFAMSVSAEDSKEDYDRFVNFTNTELFSGTSVLLGPKCRVNFIPFKIFSILTPT